jgi:hypothetical protein
MLPTPARMDWSSRMALMERAECVAAARRWSGVMSRASGAEVVPASDECFGRGERPEAPEAARVAEDHLRVIVEHPAGVDVVSA